MRFYKVAILLLIFLLMSNFSYATYKEDLVIALGKTYFVGRESYKLPEDIRVKAINYLRTHYFTEEQCKEILKCIDDAVAFANKIGTLDISKISGENVDKGLSYAYKAIDIAKSAPTFEELELIEQSKQEALEAETKVEVVNVIKIEDEVKVEVENEVKVENENKVESKPVVQVINDKKVPEEKKPVSSIYEDNIDYSKYIDESQFEDVNYEEIKTAIVSEITNYSAKKIAPFIIGFIVFVIIIVIIIKKLSGGRRK